MSRTVEVTICGSGYVLERISVEVEGAADDAAASEKIRQVLSASRALTVEPEEDPYVQK